MQEKDFYLYIDGKPVQVSGEVYREYYRAEDKERYFMGKLKKGSTKVNPETQEIQYIPSRELSYEQLVEQDWQFTAAGDSVEDRAVRADMLEKLQDVLQRLSTEELSLLNDTTSGGGMLVSEDEEAVKKALFLATQARDPARHYQHSQIGYNYRMSNVVAGIGRGQLLHLEEHKARKQAIYNQYREAFADIPEITMNPLNPDGEANNWLSGMLIGEGSHVTPDMIMDALEAENIESRPVWKPMHEQPVFAACDFVPHNGDGSSVGSDIFTRGLCLPSDIKNTPEDMELIIGIIRKCFGR